MTRVFGSRSIASLSTVHPLLASIATEALQVSECDFTVIQGARSKEDQEKAFAEGHSKVHYGDSAHTALDKNGKPLACGIDVLPYPFTNYDDPAMKPKWRAIFAAFEQVAARHNVRLRWGGGIPDASFSWDLPHIELHPWRNYAGK